MSTENEVSESSNKIENEEVFDSSAYEISSWDELEISGNILRGIYAYGFEKPSPIQQKAIKPIIMGKDIIAQAQSGTGKTATFSIGALSMVNMDKNETQVLILSPTRELTTQTAKVISSIGSLMESGKKETLRVQIVFGGSSYEEYSGFSNKNIPHVICGCPGRVYDMLRRDKLSIKTIKLVILDEADEMLSSGFKDQIYNIFQYFNNDIQVALFSATLPESITPIIEKIMRDPVKICVKAEMLTLEGIGQYYIAVDDDRQKYETLKHIFSYLSMSQCIIYCNSVKRVCDLYEAMREDEFPVINFDLPKDIHTYLHRIGRSGRWGRKGTGINFITRRDVGKMKEIERHYATEIKELPIDNLAFLS